MNKSNWRRVYQRRLISHALQASRWWPEEKKRFLERCSERKAFHQKKLLADFFLCCLYPGITEDDWYTFCFDCHDWSYRLKCISKQRQFFICNYLNAEKDRKILSSKVLFAQHWNEFFLRKWCPIRPADPIDEDEFVKLFKDVDLLISKPISDAGGRGIRVHETGNLSALYRQLLQEKKNLIVEEYIHQDGLLHELNPSSLNTLRVCTLRDENEIRILFCKLRFGIPGNVVDNSHSGGTLVQIDRDSGRAIIAVDYNGNLLQTMPNLDIPVTDFQVPRFFEALDWCRKAHLAGPEGLGLIGWDLCICRDRFYMIEANHLPAFTAPYHDDPWREMKDYLDRYDERRNREK